MTEDDRGLLTRTSPRAACCSCHSTKCLYPTTLTAAFPRGDSPSKSSNPTPGTKESLILKHAREQLLASSKLRTCVLANSEHSKKYLRSASSGPAVPWRELWAVADVAASAATRKEIATWAVVALIPARRVRRKKPGDRRCLRSSDIDPGSASIAAARGETGIDTPSWTGKGNI